VEAVLAMLLLLILSDEAVAIVGKTCNDDNKIKNRIIVKLLLTTFSQDYIHLIIFIP
jgi:hypothetical protein